MLHSFVIVPNLSFIAVDIFKHLSYIELMQLRLVNSSWKNLIESDKTLVSKILQALICKPIFSRIIHSQEKSFQRSIHTMNPACLRQSLQFLLEILAKLQTNKEATLKAYTSLLHAATDLANSAMILTLTQSLPTSAYSYSLFSYLYGNRNGHNHLPHDLAIINDDLEAFTIVANLLDNFWQVDSIHNRALILAAKSGSINVAKYLICNGVDPNCIEGSFPIQRHYELNSPLKQAVVCNQAEVVDFLVHDVKVWIDSLSISCTNMKCLCRNHYKDMTLLKYAKIHCEPRIFDSLSDFESTAELEAFNLKHPLQLAVLRCDLPLLNNCVDSSSNSNLVKDRFGRNLLHLAVLNGYNKHLIKVLVSSQVQIDCKDSFGMTPLHYAVEEGHAEKIELLVKCLDDDLDWVKNDLLMSAFLHEEIQFRQDYGLSAIFNSE